MALGSETANLLIKISADASATKGAFSSLSKSMNDLQGLAVKVGAAIGAAFALNDVIQRTRAWGRELDDLVDTLGLSGESAAKWNYQAKIVGTTAEDIVTSFSQLTRKVFDSLPALDQGTSEFDKWGIAVRDASGSLLDTETIVENVRRRVQELGPGLQTRALEMDIFGRAGGRLHDFLSLSNNEIEQMTEDMAALGINVTTGGVAAMEQMERQMNRLGIIFDVVKVQIGSALIPILTILSRHAIPAVSGAFKVVGEAMRAPLSILKDLFERFRVFASDLKEKGIWTAITSLATDLMNEVGKILGNVGSWISDNWPAWRTAIGQLWDNLVSWISETGWPTLVSFMETQIPAFAGWIVESAPIWAKNLGELLGSAARWFLGTGIPTFVGALATAIPKVGGWLLDAIGWMSHIGIPAVLSTLSAIGGAILRGIVDGLGDLKTKIWNWIIDAIPAARAIEDAIRDRLPGDRPGFGEPGGPIGPPLPPPAPVPPLAPGFPVLPALPASGFAVLPRDIEAGLSGPVAEYLARSGVTFAAHGFNGLVNRPSLFVAGEHGPETVSISPGGASWNGTNIFNINGAQDPRLVAQEVSAILMRQTRATGNWSYR